MLVNLLLLRGNIGKPGAGICPVRGHSNVQGQRTVGITEKPEAGAARQARGALRLRAAAREGPEHGRGLRGDASTAAVKASSGSAATSCAPCPIPRRWSRPGRQLRPDRADRDQAQPQPSLRRRGDLSPALPRPHRDRQAGDAARRRSRWRIRPACIHGSRGQAQARQPASALRAGDRRRDRQGDSAAKPAGRLGRLGRRLCRGARRDRGDLSRAVQGLQRADVHARRLPAAAAARASASGRRDRQGEFHRAREPDASRHRARARTSSG